ncbi:MAG: ATP-binding cassette domain-containing protein, partial [candidate division Zixibacteria bacterium]|nr:ATP-binding cassette domain-containing protein [candidate division Zixibacteria bacterium]
MSDYAVDINNLTRKFGNFTAVDHISLEVRKGEIFAFLGPNGAGKSTTIKMLTGLLLPTSGNGTVGGFDIMRESEKIKQNIGYMSQKFSLYDDLSPEENLLFFGGVYNVKGETLKQRIEDLFENTPIGKSRNSATANLPLGLKQRLALECALLHEPSILFLDEPTAGVDPMARRGFWNIIYNASKKGTTVFLTTHYMDEAEHADRVGMIFSGRLKAIDTPEDLKSDFSGGKIFQFDTDDLVAALKKLEQSEEVREVTVFGNSIHLTMAEEFDEEKTGVFLNKLNVAHSGLNRT